MKNVLYTVLSVGGGGGGSESKITLNSEGQTKIKRVSDLAKFLENPAGYQCYQNNTLKDVFQRKI